MFVFDALCAESAAAAPGAGIGFPGSDGGSFWNSCVLVGFCLFKPVVVPMFFCIAGYFSPPSLDKKGPHAFVKKNFMRLGVPFFVFWLILNPLMYTMSYALVDPVYNVTKNSNWEHTQWRDASYSYFPNSPHTWFLLWLLVFQCGYATLEGPPLLMDKVPTFQFLATRLTGTAVMQLVAGLFCLFGGSTLGLAEMPMLSPGDGFFNVRYQQKCISCF